MRRQKGVLSLSFVGILVVAAGCGTTHSHFTYDPTFQLNVPQTKPGCYDAAVLLGASLPQAKEIARQSLMANNGRIIEETETYLYAVRLLRYLGSDGSEELKVRLEKVEDNQTFVTVTTFTFGGNAKPWSCEVINEMVLRAEYD